jgi:hypothetical protein
MDSSPASSSASSPPLTPVTTPLVPYTTQRAFANASFTPLSLSQPSSECPSPVSAFDTATVLPSRASTSSISPFSQSQHDSFSSFSAYSEYGAVTSPLQASQEIGSASSSQPGSPYGCVPPTLLYSPSSITPANTPSSSRVASPDAAQGQTQASYHPLSAQASTSASASSPTSPSPTSTPRASTTLSRPASSLLLSKPFRCPKPNCNKSYKQANGLKYHMTHGSCNFAPPKDLEALQALLAEKGVVVNGNERSGVQITEGELREVEREAERRLRPFACGVGDCQRRYKNMNGLRTSLPPPRYCPIWTNLMDLCRISLPALGRPRRNWPSVARIGAARMFAAFQVSRGDSSIDSLAECCRVPNIAYQVYCVTVLGLSTGLWPVPILTAAVLGAVVFLTSATTVHRATGARAPSAILKLFRQKVADWLNSHINHIFPCMNDIEPILPTSYV